MTPTLSPNTQAILLLTAPLLARRGDSTRDLLTPSEYKWLARHLRELHHQPADLLSPEAEALLRACQRVVDEERLRRLLGRGFLLGQVIEHWQARAIWVVSRADSEYPRRLKARLRENAPAVLYGCGDVHLLEAGGLAVVGSRHADDALIEYTLSIGRLAAQANRTLISGGAKGVDQAAMRGALEADGKACGILADSLEKTVMNREHRNHLLGGQLTLLSPYDPSASFNVGNAMQRNKLIYGLADASLVVSSAVERGGTWAGAVEQLDKLRFVPVYIRSTGEPSAGLDALRKRGALVWPNPDDMSSFEAVTSASASVSDVSTQNGLPLFTDNVSADGKPDTPPLPEQPALCRRELPPANVITDRPDQTQHTLSGDVSTVMPAGPTEETGAQTPAEMMFATVRDLVRQILSVSMKDTEVANALAVSPSQTRAWLQRLVDEGTLEKQKKSGGYVAKAKRLLE